MPIPPPVDGPELFDMGGAPQGADEIQYAIARLELAEAEGRFAHLLENDR